MSGYDLEDRLIRSCTLIIRTFRFSNIDYAQQHLFRQLIRSSTSAALNYAEARGAQSRKDFIHKMHICLKELRESYVCLKIIRPSGLHDYPAGIEEAISEFNELISIFVSSIQTARSNG